MDFRRFSYVPVPGAVCLMVALASAAEGPLSAGIGDRGGVRTGLGAQQVSLLAPRPSRSAAGASAASAALLPGVVTPQQYGAVADDSRDDTRAIQAAINAVSLPPDDARVGVVKFPTGTYRVSEPLFVGYDFQSHPDPQGKLIAHFGPSSEDTRPGARRGHVLLHGLGKVRLLYVGPKTDRYLIYYAPSDVGSGYACLKNLWLDCGFKCRGFFVYHVGYGAILEGLEVRQSRQVAFDLVACWGSSIRRIITHDCRGIAVRGWGHNSIWADTWKIGSHAADHVDSRKRSELRKFISQHGLAAARQQFGESMIEDWPPEDEDAIVDWGDEPVRTPAEKRAAVVISKSDFSSFHSLCLEGIHNGEYPAVTIDGRGMSLRNLRFEHNTLTGPKIRVLEHQDNNLIEMVALADGLAESTCAVECVGSSVNNTFRNFFGGGISEAAVVFRGRRGDYFHGNVVEQMGVYNPSRPPAKFDLQGGATQAGNRIEGLPTSPVELDVSSPTPSVWGQFSSYYQLRRPGSTLLVPAAARGTIEDFVDGFDGMEIRVVFRSGGVTLKHNSQRLKLQGARDYGPQPGEVLQLLRIEGVWVETGRIPTGAR